MYVRHAVSMAVDAIFHYLHRCRSHDMSSLSHIPKRKTGSSLTVYIYGPCTENHAVNVMNTTSATSNKNYPGCCGTTCARNAMQIMCNWLFISFCIMWSHNVVCFVLPSCCTTPGSDPIDVNNSYYCSFAEQIICTLHGYVQ